MTEKFCVKCGKKFNATGREVICPSCREAAKAEAKKAAVLKAKKASWNGESVPVRISGRASTVIRAYGAEKCLPFAAALDELLKQSACFKGMQMSWEDITPYKSRRRDKHATEDASMTENKQDAQKVKQDKPEAHEKPVKPIKTAAKVASKTTSRASTSKGGKKA